MEEAWDEIFWIASASAAVSLTPACVDAAAIDAQTPATTIAQTSTQAVSKIKP